MEDCKEEHAKGSEVIVIRCGNDEKAKKGDSLQEAFKKFRKERQKAICLSKQVSEGSIQWRADPKRMNNLRMRFVEQCKQYFGVPYAKKYQEPGTPEYNSPLFLDCCGLIRRVLRDLKEDFGFVIGPWNQAYMFDTLPLDVENTADLKPGDLVFVSGIYHNPKSKKQRHNMVHVEVWAGNGDKTIGARWQRGKVQYHNSYKFNAKSYHSMQYHFKSIDTWLKGICKSHCPEHAWKRSKYKPGKKSIFAENQASETPDEDAEQEAAVDDQVQCKDANKKPLCTLKNNNYANCFSGKSHDVLRCFTTSNTVLKKPVTNAVSRCDGPDIDKKVLSNTDTMQVDQTVFCDLDECVHWLLSKVMSELENELDNGNSSCEDQVKTHSSVNVDKDLRGGNQRRVEMSTIQRNRCSCQQCHPVEMNNYCIHQYNFDNSGTISEDEFRSLEDNIDLCSSLECFEFMEAIGDDEFSYLEDHRDLTSSLESFGFVSGGAVCSGKAFSVVHCPNNSNASGNHSTERSFSPSKTPKNKEEFGRSFSSGKGQGKDDDKKRKGKDSPDRNLPGSTRSVGLLNGKQPSFFIGGSNGNWMIESTLVSLGWSKVEDKMDKSFKLKWVECKSQINYSTFRDGEQLVNHISNMNLLTTKLGLLNSLQEYQRVQQKVAGRSASKLLIPISEFVPETYKLMNATEKTKFVNDIYKDGETWICKPTGMNQGKGIYLISGKEQLMEKLKINAESDGSRIRRTQMTRHQHGRVIQRYVMNPLLLNGFKFDVRTYMLIASTTPYVVFYHPGYVRLSCVPYTPYTQDATGLHAHLTNQYVQKKHPMYSSMKEDTVWDFDHLQSYIDEKYTEEKGLPENWVYTAFTKRMHQIMTTCFHSVRQKLHRRTGTFDLLGFDFLIDDEFKVWLLEVNINPALHTNCKVLMDLLPGVVDETLKLVIEIFEKTKKRRPLFPLENQKGFQLIYNGEGK